MRHFIFSITLLLSLSVMAPASYSKVHHKKHHRMTRTAIKKYKAKGYGFVAPNIAPSSLGRNSTLLMSSSDMSSSIVSDACDTECYLNSAVGMPMSVASPLSTTMQCVSPNPALCNVQNVNSTVYSAATPRPAAIPTQYTTIDGFRVPITGNVSYFSPLKHRRGEPMPVHNHKGESYGTAEGLPSYSASTSGQ